MRARARYGRIIAAGGAAVVAGATLLPAAAQAAPGDKKFAVEKTGKILAEGAAVKVKFTYNCPDGWEGGAGVTIVEALGEAFASGYGGKTLKCTGKDEDATFFIQANTYEGSRPFRAGNASIVANLDAWNPQGGQCGYGGPCPVEGDAMAVPPPGGGKMSAAPERPALPGDKMPGPANMHKDWSGVIKLS
jgi:hypothetical protein